MSNFTICFFDGQARVSPLCEAQLNPTGLQIAHPGKHIVPAIDADFEQSTDSFFLSTEQRNYIVGLIRNNKIIKQFLKKRVADLGGNFRVFFDVKIEFLQSDGKTLPEFWSYCDVSKAHKREPMHWVGICLDFVAEEQKDDEIIATMQTIFPLETKHKQFPHLEAPKNQELYQRARQEYNQTVVFAEVLCRSFTEKRGLSADGKEFDSYSFSEEACMPSRWTAMTTHNIFYSRPAVLIRPQVRKELISSLKPLPFPQGVLPRLEDKQVSLQKSISLIPIDTSREQILANLIQLNMSREVIDNVLDELLDTPYLKKVSSTPSLEHIIEALNNEIKANAQLNSEVNRNGISSLASQHFPKVNRSSLVGLYQTIVKELKQTIPALQEEEKQFAESRDVQLMQIKQEMTETTNQILLLKQALEQLEQELNGTKAESVSDEIEAKHLMLEKTRQQIETLDQQNEAKKAIYKVIKHSTREEKESIDINWDGYLFRISVKNSKDLDAKIKSFAKLLSELENKKKTDSAVVGKSVAALFRYLIVEGDVASNHPSLQYVLEQFSTKEANLKLALNRAIELQQAQEDATRITALIEQNEKVIGRNLKPAEQAIELHLERLSAGEKVSLEKIDDLQECLHTYEQCFEVTRAIDIQVIVFSKEIKASFLTCLGKLLRQLTTDSNRKQLPFNIDDLKLSEQEKESFFTSDHRGHQLNRALFKLPDLDYEDFCLVIDQTRQLIKTLNNFIVKFDDGSENEYKQTYKELIKNLANSIQKFYDFRQCHPYVLTALLSEKDDLSIENLHQCYEIMVQGLRCRLHSEDLYSKALVKPLSEHTQNEKFNILCNFLETTDRYFLPLDTMVDVLPMMAKKLESAIEKKQKENEQKKILLAKSIFKGKGSLEDDQNEVEHVQYADISCNS